MKILLAHKFFAITGGAEFFYHEVGRVLSENGHEVAYFSSKDDSVDTPWRGYFPSVASHKEGNLLHKIIGFPRMVYNTEAKHEMARLIADFKPDIIHAFAIYVELTPSILDAAREAGVPVVMSCNDYKHICPNYKLYHHGKICEDCRGGKFYSAIVNRCCHNSLVYSVASAVELYAHEAMNSYRKNVHTFLFASEFMARKTEEFWQGKNFKSAILRNPFDAKKHKATSKLGDYALYFGRIIDEKGVDVLLEAAALAPEIPLVVVGDGPDLASLKQHALDRGLRQVKFVGAKWGDELNEILAACRFVVVPSIWHENFPYVILQSFAMGKPVIGSDRGGIPELVSHGERGLIYPAINPAALAEGMRSLMSDDDTTSRMAEAAKQYADAEFNDDKFYANLMQIYNGVVR